MFGDDAPYKGILHKKSLEKAQIYLESLMSNGALPGKFLKSTLASRDSKTLTIEVFIECLLNTKKPQIFAESSVYGDGSDWNAMELSILGDISMAMDVTIFDNGLHHNPKVYAKPLEGTLLYTPGALLRNGTGNIPVDWEEVVVGTSIDYDSFYSLYERRLLPCLRYANDISHAKGTKAFVTIPGLGCGQFAGKFKGSLGALLNQVLQELLTKYAAGLTSIRAVYFDPFDECDNERIEIGGISYLLKPLLKGNEEKGQLCSPESYEESKGEFAKCNLISVVAWDHVSWPGNDFYIDSRATDDGVKAAATNTMSVMTGIAGTYCASSNKYLPPNTYNTWDELIVKNQVSLMCDKNLVVYAS